jgi:hypothetical protein
MHRTQDCKDASATVLLPFAAVALSAGALLLVPVAEAQMNPPQARPQAQAPHTPSLQTPSPSAPISDEKLNAAAAVLGQVATTRQSYESKIAAPPPSDKQRLAKERNDARLPIRVFLWMNAIALSVQPKTTPRSTKSSFNVFRILAIRGV